MQIVIETTEYRPGGFRADGHLPGDAKRPRWLRQLVETDASAIGAYLRLSERIESERQGETFEFLHAAP